MSDRITGLTDGQRWREMVRHEWTLWHFPSMESGNTWQCVKAVGLEPGEQHVVGRGRSAEEAIDHAILSPEWSPQ